MFVPNCDMKPSDLNNWLSIGSLIMLNDPKDLSHTVDLEKCPRGWKLTETNTNGYHMVSRKVGVYRTTREAKDVGEALLGFKPGEVE